MSVFDSQTWECHPIFYNAYVLANKIDFITSPSITLLYAKILTNFVMGGIPKLVGQRPARLGMKADNKKHTHNIGKLHISIAMGPLLIPSQSPKLDHFHCSGWETSLFRTGLL